ncbi:13054_t:CDS:2, partial [Racocetra persica]
CTATLAGSRFISPALFPKTYNSLPRIKRLSWDLHWVSMAHCLTVIFLSFPLLYQEELQKDKIFGYNAYAGNVYSIACGYFLWDALISLYYVKEFGFGFALHGICCFGVFIFAFRPFLNYYGSVFLMYEISTPFLNVHWFMDKLGLGGTLPHTINGVCLLTSFFFVRIIYGCYMSYQVFLAVLPVVSQIPVFLCVLYGTANIMLNCLNVYWFVKMIAYVSRPSAKYNVSDGHSSKSHSKVKKQ